MMFLLIHLQRKLPVKVLLNGIGGDAGKRPRAMTVQALRNELEDSRSTVNELRNELKAQKKMFEEKEEFLQNAFKETNEEVCKENVSLAIKIREHENQSKVKHVHTSWKDNIEIRKLTYNNERYIRVCTPGQDRAATQAIIANIKRCEEEAEELEAKEQEQDIFDFFLETVFLMDDSGDTIIDESDWIPILPAQKTGKKSIFQHYKEFMKQHFPKFELRPQENFVKDIRNYIQTYNKKKSKEDVAGVRVNNLSNDEKRKFEINTANTIPVVRFCWLNFEHDEKKARTKALTTFPSDHLLHLVFWKSSPFF